VDQALRPARPRPRAPAGLDAAGLSPRIDSTGEPAVTLTGTQHPTETPELGLYIDGIFQKCSRDTPLGPNGYGVCFFAARVGRRLCGVRDRGVGLVPVHRAASLDGRLNPQNRPLSRASAIATMW
jgi:hypothetical protein